jgi:hypothetical protein
MRDRDAPRAFSLENACAGQRRPAPSGRIWRRDHLYKYTNCAASGGEKNAVASGIGTLPEGTGAGHAARTLS